MNNQDMKLLIVDDDRTFANMVGILLENWGYEPLVYTSSSKALSEIFNIQKPLILLLDWAMPEYDGEEVLQRIRMIGLENPVYIIVITGQDSEDQLEKAFQAGADDFIPKPFKEKELQSRLKAGIRTLELQTLSFCNNQQIKSANDNLTQSLDIIRKDEEAAEKIQNRMLPENNLDIGSYNFSYIFKPAMFLSGDSLDYLKKNEKNIVFYFADVQGQGASAALAAVSLKTYIDTHFRSNYECHLTPPEFIHHINRLMLDDNLGLAFSFLFGVIDLSSGILTLYNCGQTPPPVICHDRGKTFLSKTGTLLGHTTNIDIQYEEIAIKPDTSLFLFSNGIIDLIKNKAGRQWKMALLDLIDSDKTSLDELSRKLGLEEIEAFSDDISALKVCWKDF